MILRNSKGYERNFKVLFKIEYQNNCYLVYEDFITGKCYAGLKDSNHLKKVSKDDLLLVDKILEGVNKEWKKL